MPSYRATTVEEVHLIGAFLHDALLDRRDVAYRSDDQVLSIDLLRYGYEWERRGLLHWLLRTYRYPQVDSLLEIRPVRAADMGALAVADEHQSSGLLLMELLCRRDAIEIRTTSAGDTPGGTIRAILSGPPVVTVKDKAEARPGRGVLSFGRIFRSTDLVRRLEVGT